MFSVFEIIAFEPVAGISLIYHKNTADRQSTCYQTLPEFWILSREMFSNSISAGLIEDWDKTAALQGSAVFGICEHFDYQRVF